MPTGKNYQGRDGEARFLDNTQAAQGNNATPFGLRLSFSQMDMQLSYTQRPEDILHLDRERLTNDAHYLVGSEASLAEPVNVTMSMMCSTEETDAVMDFIGVNWANQESATPNAGANIWNVKGTPTTGLISTRRRALTGSGRYGGGRIDSKGSAILLPLMADKKKVFVDLEVIWAERDGSKQYGMRLKEIYFEPGEQQISESADSVVFNLTGRMYGEAQRVTAFTLSQNVLKGTDVVFGANPFSSL